MKKSLQLTILLVEDERITAMLTKKALEKYGYAVITVTTGEKAVEYIDTKTGVDLILMDIDLGKGIDGTEAASQILSRHDIPLVFHSSHTEPETVEKTEKISSYGYVVKNSTSTVLHASIKMAIKLFYAKKLAQKKEQALLKSEKRFRNLFEEAPLGMALIDSITGQMYEINSMFAKIAGRTKEEMAGVSWMSITHPDDIQLDLDNMALMNSGQTNGFRMQKRYVRPDNSIVWVNMTIAKEKKERDTKPKHFCMIEDITERKQEEIFSKVNRDVLLILNEPEDFNHSIQRILSIIKTQIGYDAVAIRLQDGDGFPYYTQDGFTKNFIKTQNCLIERDDTGKLCRGPDGKIRLLCTCGQVISGKNTPQNPYYSEGGSFWTNENAGIPFPDTRFHPRDRCLRDGYKSIVLSPIRNRDEIVGLIQINDFQKGRFTLRIVELVENIASHIGTAFIRRQDEKKIKTLLAEKELILKEVHHRIKNNMNTIYGLLTLQALSITDEATVTSLTDAGNRVRSMMHLYDKLYKNDDVTALSIKKYLPTLIEEIISNFQSKEEVTLDIHIDKIILPTTTLQPLGIIVNELLTNIMKYAFKGKTAGVISVSAKLTGNLITLIIADNGNGIPESVSFDKSSGFGLVLVKGLTHQLGGNIRLERGQGTKFILEFEN